MGASFVAHTFRKLIANNLDIKGRTVRMMTRAPFICLLFVSTVSANLLGGLGWSWPVSLPSLANLTTWQPGNLANLAPVPSSLTSLLGSPPSLLPLLDSRWMFLRTTTNQQG